MPTIINGRVYAGHNVSIIKGVVMIDGKKVEQPDNMIGVIEVRITEGTPISITTDASVSCDNVAGNVTAGGSVNCGDISRNANAGGSVNCGDIGGNVNAGGSVRCSSC